MKATVFVILLLFVTLVHAAASDEQNQPATPGESTTGGSAFNPFAALGEWLSKSIMDFAAGFITSTLNFFMGFFYGLITLTIHSTDSVLELNKKIVNLLAGFYVIILMWNALQIVTSGMLSRQVNARFAVQNTIISMILVVASVPLYNMVLNVSSGLTSYVAGGAVIQPENFNLSGASMQTGILAVLFPIMLLLLIIIVIFLLILVLLRLMIVSLGPVLFPIGIFLYFFSPTKKLGNLTLYVLFFFIFLPVIESLFLWAFVHAIVSAPDMETGVAAISQLDETMLEMMVNAMVIMGVLLAMAAVPIVILVVLILIVAFPAATVPILAGTAATAVAGSTAGAVASSGVKEGLK